MAFINLFKNNLQTSLEKDINRKPLLYRELTRLAQDEQAITIASKRQVHGVYTYPKFPGVAFFVDQLAKEKIPFIVKVKVLTQEGAAGIVVVPSREIDDNEPVVVLRALQRMGASTSLLLGI